jgi:hypothetical protein
VFEVVAVVAVVDPGAATFGARIVPEEPVGVGPVLAASDAGVRAAAALAEAVCEAAGFGAVVFEGDDAVSEVGAVASGDFREPVVETDAADAVADVEVPVEAGDPAGPADGAFDVGAAEAAERVGGTGASPDPRSEASIIGDAHVPEYAASEGAAAQEPDVEADGEPEFVPASGYSEAAEAGESSAGISAAAGVALEPAVLVTAVGASADLGLDVLAPAGELTDTGPEAFVAAAAESAGAELEALVAAEEPTDTGPEAIVAAAAESAGAELEVLVPAAAESAGRELKVLAPTEELADAGPEACAAVAAKPADTGPVALVAAAAESDDVGLAAFAAAGLLEPWPEVGTAGIPDPAGDLSESIGDEALAVLVLD